MTVTHLSIYCDYTLAHSHTHILELWESERFKKELKSILAQYRSIDVFKSAMNSLKSLRIDFEAVLVVWLLVDCLQLSFAPKLLSSMHRSTVEAPDSWPSLLIRFQIDLMRKSEGRVSYVESSELLTSWLVFNSSGSTSTSSSTSNEMRFVILGSWNWLLNASGVISCTSLFIESINWPFTEPVINLFDTSVKHCSNVTGDSYMGEAK